MDSVNPILAQALELLQRGDAVLAEREFAQAAAASCSAFGENDIVTARMLAHLARLCVSRGKLDVAVPMYERIIRIHEALPVPSNTDHAVALMELADLKGKCGTDCDAESLRRKADDIIVDVQARMQQEADAREESDGEESSEYSSEGGSDDSSSDGRHSIEADDDNPNKLIADEDGFDDEGHREGER